MTGRGAVTKSSSQAFVSQGGEEGELEAMLERLPALLGQADVEGARALARDLVHRWPDDDRVCYWARVLAPPQVTVEYGEPTRVLDRERAWLREHAQEYPGCWLAVYGDQLVAADRDLTVVLAQVRATPGAETAVLYQQPALCE